MPKRKILKKGIKKSGPTLMNLKVSDAERRALHKAARRYANGNLSEWLRFAGINFRPVKMKSF